MTLLKVAFQSFVDFTIHFTAHYTSFCNNHTHTQARVRLLGCLLCALFTNPLEKTAFEEVKVSVVVHILHKVFPLSFFLLPPRYCSAFKKYYSPTKRKKDLPNVCVQRGEIVEGACFYIVTLKRQAHHLQRQTRRGLNERR